jgi:signal transduction histidine kinase
LGGSSHTTTIQLPNGNTISITQESSQQAIAMVATVNPSTEPANPEQNWALVGPRELFPHWLGWLSAVPGGPVRGMLLSWDAMEKSMNAAFPEHLDAADGFVLKNPIGKPVIAHFANGALVVGGHGDDPVDDLAAIPAFDPAYKLPIGAEMPGWTLSIYFNPEAKFSSHFMVLSTVLVTVLVISVLVGGTLLMREARREAFDAARKTSFVSNVSHELKTPLTTIRMYAELLGEGRVRDPAKQRTYLTTIINESQRLTRLVNNVLDFSRLEQGRKKYNSDDVCLAELVRSVLDAQRPRLEEAGFQVEADLASFADLRVHTDRDALEQVLLNLMDNALKYAADGHWLEVKITQKDNHALLAVSDHGPGVPADEQEKIFEMFHRVDDSITARLPGAGLGLSIARRLLRDQEGDLYYEPNPTGGASFVASLPLALAEEKNLPPPAEASLATP